MTDNKWFKGNGFLSEEGERALLEFNTALENVITHDSVRYMSMGEIYSLQANLAKKVGDAVSAITARRLQEEKNLSELSDQEFESLLVEKYGNIWPHLSLSPAEIVRAKSLKTKKHK
jgi:hypothetical protein